ncbi:MAG: sigma-70 family RNA polymerase sigma factor [Gemmatimonadales bacterium]|nr:MAG: sigma-70 family RNA polymerase sigma factor [Gemmatimonadales bacterium]
MDFDRLFDDVYPGLVRYCHRMTADADLAEDAAQEAFVRFLDRRPRGEAAGLRAWLFKVATHVLRDRARVENNRARLREHHHGEGTAGRPGGGGANGEDVLESLERKERIAAVRDVLASLEERDRTLLLMREEGFSYRELADSTGVQASSVGTLLARARRRFETELRERGTAT